MEKDKKIMSLLLPTLFFFLGILFQVLIWFNYINKNNKESIDTKLLFAANKIKELLPNDYHYLGMNKNSYDKDYSLELFEQLELEAKKLDVDYLYTLVIDKGEIRYASMSGTYEELADDPNYYYWFPLSDSGDDTLLEITEVFENPEIIFIDSKDKWGEYRSVYLPQRAIDGKFYIAGADVLTKNLYRGILINLVLVGSNIFLLILTSLPLLMALKTMRVNHKEFELKVNKLRTYDELTGVYNRNSGVSIINNHIKLYDKYNINFAIFLVDIANLEEVNKNQGIKRGDILIKVLGAILKYTFRRSDKVIRLGEDDFIVVLSDCSEETSKIFTEKLLEKISIFNSQNRNDYLLRVHVTYEEYRGQGLDDYLEGTIEKLENKKKKGSFYDLTLQEMMKEGLEKGEFMVFFQPKVNINTKKVAFEALIRWEKDGKFISPDKFIPVAERSYLIFTLTKFVLDKVIDAIEKYNIHVSINISPVIFEKDTFYHSLINRIKECPYRDHITFEITEGIAIKNLNLTLEKMILFRKLNVEFSLDDFGTGYSSLGYLSILPMNEVKIDKTFVNKLNERAENRLIIEMIVKLGKLLGFYVIAEGVEDKEHIKRLIELGCYIFQGFYFDRAVPLEEALSKYDSGYYSNLITNVFKKEE